LVNQRAEVERTLNEFAQLRTQDVGFESNCSYLLFCS
jgi:hypothetical protein